MRTGQDSTGHVLVNEQGCDRPPAPVPSATAAAARNVPGAAWINEAMVEDTRRHWSPRYGRDLSDAEAVEILMNVKRLAQVLWKGGQNP